LAVDQIFWSSEKSKKIWSTDYETFDQLKKHNFDQVNFGQTTPCRWKQSENQSSWNEITTQFQCQLISLIIVIKVCKK